MPYKVFIIKLLECIKINGFYADKSKKYFPKYNKLN